MPPTDPGRPKKKLKKRPAPSGPSAVGDTKADLRRGEPERKKNAALARERATEAKDTKSAADRARAPAYVKSLYPKRGKLKIIGEGGKVKGDAPDSVLPPDIAKRVSNRKFAERRAKRQANITAPAVRALNETLRPVRGVAKTVDEVVNEGKDPISALKTGGEAAVKNEGPLFSDVLKKAGAPKAVQTVGGFALDVAADPATYVTLGASVPARKLAQKEGERVLRKARAKGMSEEGAQRVAQRAAKRTLERSPKNKGLTVGVRAKVPLGDKGIDVKTAGRTTAALSRKVGASKAATKVRESAPVQAIGRAIAPDFRPKGRTPEAHATIRAAEREHRARVVTAQRAVQRRYGKALRKAVPGRADQRAVIDAIEAGTTHELPDTLRNTAKTLERDFGGMLREGRKRGLSTRFRSQGPEDAKAYLPHVRRIDTEKGAKRQGGGVTTVSSDKGRSLRMPLKTLRDKDPSIFTEDLPAIAATKATKEAERASLHDLWQKVASTGREVKPGRDNPIDMGGERFYKVTPEGLEAVVKAEGAPDLKRMGRIVDGKEAGRFVVLDRDSVELVKKRLQGGKASDEGVTRAYDRAQGKIKKLFTIPLPSYHARNIYGDTQNAFLGDASANSFRQSVGILRSRASVNRAEGSVEQFTKGGKAAKRGGQTVKIRGREVTHAQILKEAEEHGAINQGFIGRELEDLAGEGGKVARATQYREDAPRLATYLSARKRGMTPSDAAEWTNSHLFDYGDITQWERAFARRAIPFYTFFARNTRLQATKIVTRPGKHASIAKVLEESSKAAGYNDYEEYVKSLKDYEQRGLPIPVKVGGKVHNVFIGLPATDLNQLTASPAAQWQNIGNRITFFKLAAELPANYSVFFQGAIQREEHPWVRAPGIVRHLPKPLRNALGVTNEWVNPKTGKKEWAWFAKADYAMRSSPEGNFILQQLLPERGSRNQTAAQSRVALLTGVRVTPKDTPERKLSQVGERLHDIEVQMSHMRDTGKAGKDGYYTPAYQRLLDEHKKLADQRDAVRKELGRPEARRLKRRPLDAAGQIDKELDDFARKAANPRAEIDRELDEFLQKQR